MNLIKLNKFANLDVRIFENIYLYIIIYYFFKKQQESYPQTKLNPKCKTKIF